MFTAPQYASGLDDNPSTNPADLGAGFIQQTPNGSYGDDRIAYLSGDESDNGQTVTGLGGNYGGEYPTIEQGEREEVWYSTLRPQAGFPLDLDTDVSVANRTGVFVGDTVHDPAVPDAFTVDGHRLLERSFDVPARLSTLPAEIQQERPFDIAMGAWPWTGVKVSMQAPSAASPKTFDSPVIDAIPSPTGTSAADNVDYDLQVRPLTFRTPPEPWDTGNDGFYVESGN